MQGKLGDDAQELLIDVNTETFNRIVAVCAPLAGTDEEKAAKPRAVQDASEKYIKTSFRVMKTSLRSMEVWKALAEIGNRASVSDANAGVGALPAHSGVMGVYLNVKINAGDVEDKKWMRDILSRAQSIQGQDMALERQSMEILNTRLTYCDPRS
ncbi:MAG: cyclodeaminase/cyclohydrolase family protein [Phycisphaerales bacterium]|nr:MAG: cyclodeaminase/cyclohydrolase family protein [Phycisphaerales bacterium]